MFKNLKNGLQLIGTLQAAATLRVASQITSRFSSPLNSYSAKLLGERTVAQSLLSLQGFVLGRACRLMPAPLPVRLAALGLVAYVGYHAEKDVIRMTSLVDFSVEFPEDTKQSEPVPAPFNDGPIPDSYN